MEIIVKNCRNCPFCEINHIKDDNSDKLTYSLCLFPNQHGFHVTSYYDDYKSPKKCPLKKQDLTIKFKK